VHDDGTPEASGRIHHGNISFTEDLLTWSGKTGAARAIFISSFSVVSRPLVTPITEAHPLGPTTAYACSKFWGEQLLGRYAATGRIIPVILRISSPVPRHYARLPDTVLKKWILSARERQPIRVFGNGSRSQDFVSCDDIAKAVSQCMDAPHVSGTYNIAGGKSLSMREAAEAIAAILGTGIAFEGADSNENERWEISIAKAAAAFGYMPECAGISAVARVARSAL
jgi:nucleoside-diphosphate-sugar epimerase